jgi:hypothetical protein
VAYHEERRITHLWGTCRYVLVVRRCQNRACRRYQVSMRPEAEGALAPRHSAFGLDVITLIGHLRFVEGCSMRRIHQHLYALNVRLAVRTVTDIVHRYQALLALPETSAPDRVDRLQRQERLVLAITGVQPGRGHAVLWLLWDALSGMTLVARSLPEMCPDDLVSLLLEVVAATPVPIVAVLSDGQHAVRLAVQTVLPGVPHCINPFNTCLPACGLPAGSAGNAAASRIPCHSLERSNS